MELTAPDVSEIKVAVERVGDQRFRISDPPVGTDGRRADLVGGAAEWQRWCVVMGTGFRKVEKVDL